MVVLFIERSMRHLELCQLSHPRSADSPQIAGKKTSKRERHRNKFNNLKLKSIKAPAAEKRLWDSDTQQLGELSAG